MSGTAAMAAVIPEEKLIRVLVIDDNETFRQDMIDYFGIYGYDVDVARDPEEAKPLIEKNEYQIVLADVNFDGLNLKGDRFVLNNYKDFKGARVVIVTALNVNELRNRAALDNLNIPVWNKADQNWGQNLTGLTRETAEARKQEIAGQLNDFISDKLGDAGDYIVTGASATAVATDAVTLPPPVEPWELEVKEILIGWLESQSNPHRPLFSVGRTVFSADKMVEQVRKRTDVGKQLLEMFLTEVRYSLGLGKPISRR